jgi:phage/conjugal plasmid C-4 type zinc finger TraR family protein
VSDVADRAAEVIEAACEAGLARVQAELAGPGEVDCQTCGATIGADRRAALPSAVRCMDCQQKRERQWRPTSPRSFAGIATLMLGKI